MRIVDAHARTDVGFERDHNEDAAVTSLSHGVFVVADGMGGAPAGEIASSVAAATAADVLKAWPSVTRGPRDGAAIASAFEAADAAVRMRAEADAACLGMGTTLAVIAIEDATAWLGHVGDSRIYLLRSNELHRLTSDHGFGSVLTRAVGVHNAVPDVFAVELRDGDVLMMCTDGLSKCVGSAMMLRGLEEHALTSCELATDALVIMALAAGGPDNVTVVVMRVAA